MEIRKRYTNIKVIVAIIVTIILLAKCSGDWKGKVINTLGGYTARDVKTTIDTISIKRDTVWAKPDTIRLKAEKIVVPQVVYKYVPTPSTSSSKGEPLPPLDSVYVYNQPFSDTLINANIKTVVNINNAKIVAQNLEYTPKFPTIVKEYITIKETTTETLYNKPRNKIGIGISGSNNNQIGGTGVFQTKKDWQYQVNYSWGSGTLIPTQDYIKGNNGVVTVSIIKLF